MFSEADTVDEAEGPEYRALFVDGRMFGLVLGGRPMLTVLGVMAYQSANRYVTVDVGAVPFVCSGAEVIAPGIVNADSEIVAGTSCGCGTTGTCGPWRWARLS